MEGVSAANVLTFGPKENPAKQRRSSGRPMLFKHIALIVVLDAVSDAIRNPADAKVSARQQCVYFRTMYSACQPRSGGTPSNINVIYTSLNSIFSGLQFCR